ncbi:uncharacterized protein BJ212DRAFT_1484267 [Suillus subaureus]|uniref:HMG box domain-containing protein n=1 Tax=Suillus subaureus TaxID=48587 RepID=A0A9P7JAE5_9AGAM|nr:uncharacterized protein BJ212DRAFT_1484267 [Suillus subaureus]KAG1810698.1 hypothetical protein BJ212DRAFT_1484267 [Suillus subaureus]
MLSLFARHVVPNLPVLRTNVSSVLTSSAFAATRRTFFTTRRIELPAAASKSASTKTMKKTTKKTTATKSTPRKAKATTEAKSKPKSTAPSKKTVERPPPKRVPKSEQPPSRPPNAYLLYFSKLVQERRSDIKTTMDTQDMAKEAAVTWNNFTLAEKQPYYNEVEVLKKQYEEKLHDYWKTASPKTVRKINARRKHDGRNKIHRPHQENDYKRPKGPFFRFIEMFRQSDDGRAIQEAGTTAAGRGAVNVVRAAGEQWRAMSASDKAPYMEAYQKAHNDWQANHPSKNASTSASS